MSDVQLFRLLNGTASELPNQAATVYHELTLRIPADLERAHPLIEHSYVGG